MRKTLVLASGIVLMTTLSAFSCHHDTPPANNTAAADINAADVLANDAADLNGATPTFDMPPPAPPPPPGNPDNRNSLKKGNPDNR